MKTRNISITRAIAVALTMSALVLGLPVTGQNTWIGPAAPALTPPPMTVWDWTVPVSYTHLTLPTIYSV